MPEDDLRPDRFEIRRATLRGFGHAWLDEGEGPPLVLVHGWPETMRIWWRNVAPLAAAGFRVIVPDLRGFGETEVAPDGFHDVPAHARDLEALVRGHLGLERAVFVGGDLGGAVIQDLAARFPGLARRLVVFNAPLPLLRDRMQGLRTLPPREAMDYYLRQGRDPDGLAAELDTPAKRRAYVATFYGPRFWAHPGHFTPEAVEFMTEPFADAAKLRAGFGAYEATFDPARRSEPSRLGSCPVHTLVLFGPSDHVIHPDFDRMAEIVFPDRVGPFLLRDAGHFLQWEAAERLNGAIRAFCRDLVGAGRA
jgi:pimeloyl-ACP methyl ester carboxylesterase